MEGWCVRPFACRTSGTTPSRSTSRGRAAPRTRGALAAVIDSMVNQHAKWLATSRELSWRAPVSSLNLLITSTVWRQDHNGFTHQDPGFIDLVLNKSPNVCRVYLPPDANSLLCVAD